LISETQISVLIADDQVVLRLGVKMLLEQSPRIRVIAEAGDGEAAVELAARHRPAIVFMDIGMPKLDGIQATRIIKDNYPEIRVIVFTSNDDELAFLSALSAGADGYCLKDATEEQLLSAISAVMQGATWLDPGVARLLKSKGKSSSKSHEQAPFSPLQVRILELIEQGCELPQIAAIVEKALPDVKFELKQILNQLSEKKDDSLIHLRTIVESVRPQSSGFIHSPKDRVGTCLSGKYMIDEFIGSGGMSVVYRAHHIVMDKVVAIKMLHGHLLADGTLIQRLQNEARAAGSISHPNIVAVQDLDVIDNQPYLVMDYVVGETLEDLLKRSYKFEVERAVEIFSQVCDALDTLHSHSIVHRDLKPSNIMIVDNNGKYSIKLLDFGIAKMLSTQESGNRLTLTGQVCGSPGFMSPEQCLGKGIDSRSDLYSLGCVMYEVLTGQSAFPGDNIYNVMRMHVDELPSRLPFLRPGAGIPGELEAAVFKLLNKNADKRFQSAAEVKRELIAAPYRQL
jgi:serine/threonine-protein kinase